MTTATESDRHEMKEDVLLNSKCCTSTIVAGPLLFNRENESQKKSIVSFNICQKSPSHCYNKV